MFLQRHLADLGGGRPRRRGGGALGDVPASLRRGVRRRRASGTRSRCRRATASPGTTTRPTCAGRRSSRTCRASREPRGDIEGARVLAMLGDSVTTDHISPAGVDQGLARRRLPRRARGRAGRLQLLRRAPRQPRGDGARHVREHPPPQPARGPRRLEGGFTLHLPDGEQMSIYDAAMRYAEEGMPLVVSPARSTARARRATGRRRARSCSACAP